MIKAGVKARCVAPVMAFVAAVALGGCGSTVSSLPVVGMPSNAPPPPARTKGFLPVNDLPSVRDETPLDVNQQATMEQELSAIRARQKAAAAADAAAIAASPPPEAPSRSRLRGSAR